MFDRIFNQGDKLRRKLEFLTVNEELIDSKHQKEDLYLKDKRTDVLNYFPYTHGDAVEN